MKKAKKILAIIVTGLIIFAIGFGGGYWFCTQKAAEQKIADDAEQKPEPLDEKEKRIVTVDEVKVKLDEIRELSTYSGTYSIKKGYDQSRYILDGIRIPGTTNNVTLECEGIVKVGYDIDDIDVEIDNKSSTIYISLPKPSVNDNYVIWDTVKCTEKNTPFNPIEFEQYRKLVDEIEAEGLAKVEGEDIYLLAEDNIKNIIKNFLSGMDGYEVKFM